MTEDFEREELAFTEALRASAEAEGFRPIDPSLIRAAARPQRAGLGNWGKGLAAAAALVIVVGVGALILPRLGGVTAASGSMAAAPADAGTAPAPQAEGEDRMATVAAGSREVGAWTSTASAPLSPRSNAAGGWLDGEFYLVGGQLDPPCPAAASCLPPSRVLKDGAGYDPATDTWRKIADAPVAISDGAPVAVDGRLYYRVRVDDQPAVYAYDASADSWSKLPSPVQDGALVAAGDRLASIGESDENVTAVDELYDPDSDEWTRLPDDPLGASFDRGAAWVDGALLLWGKELVASPGSEEPAVVRLAKLDLATMTWRRLPDSEVIGSGGVAAAGLVVFPDPGSADGGQVGNWGRDYPMGGIFDPTTETWSGLPDVGGLGEGVRTTWSIASVAGDQVFASGHLLDPRAGVWTALTTPPGGNLEGQSVATGPDGMLVFGGWRDDRPTTRAEYLPLR